MRPKGSQSWAPRRPSTCCASWPRRGRKSCGSSARSCSPRCRRMLVDAHAPLDACSDRAEVVARAKAAGLVRVVAVGQWREGAGMAGAQDAIALAKEDRSFFSPTPGVHSPATPLPTEADLPGVWHVWGESCGLGHREGGLVLYSDPSPRFPQRALF